MDSTDIKIVSLTLYYLPAQARIPLRFGFETMTSTECLRVKAAVENGRGISNSGWGEVPLNMQWLWPGCCSAEARLGYMKRAIVACADAILAAPVTGHALDIGYHVITDILPDLIRHLNAEITTEEKFPWNAALAAFSAFDIAIHDAYGKVNNRPVHTTYNSEFMSQDLSFYLQDGNFSAAQFRGLYPENFLRQKPRTQLPVWHLVGGKDPLITEDSSSSGPDDGYPVFLPDWIRRDGINCLKVKLLGRDFEWDLRRLVQVGTIGLQSGVIWLSVDFNCTVNDPNYVIELLHKLLRDHPRIYAMLLYIEQPFPAEVEMLQIDVHGVSALKPLFLDEGADHWQVLPAAQALGWSGVALKTCKTYTGALLMACLAQNRGMSLMVQDLTNPMLATLSHAALAASVPTLMGFEANAAQYYPDASAAEAVVHPGIYRRKNGMVSIDSLRGNGFGYRIEEIRRVLPEPAYVKETRSVCN